MRQLITSKTTNEKHYLEGTYFRRFSPNLDQENRRHKLNYKKKNNTSIKLKLGIGTLLLFGTVSTIFFFEDYFLYRKELKNRTKSAAQYRELIKKGLLKTYPFDPEKATATLTSSFSPVLIQQDEYLSSAFRDIKFCLYSSKNSKKFNSDNHLKALNEWIKFFNNEKIKYSLKSNLNDPDCLWIFPHIKSISESELNSIRKIKRFMASGAFGALNALGKERNNNNIMFNFFSIYPLKSEIKNATVIIKGNSFNWDIPTGLLTKWSPIDSNFSAFETNTGLDIIDSNYKGEFITNKQGEETLYLSKIKITDKHIWSSLDPASDEKISYYLTKHMLAKLADIKVYNTHTYPSSENYVSSYLVSIDDPLYSFSSTLETFKDLKTPFTLFTNSSTYAGIHSLIDENFHFELALKSSNEDRLSDISDFDHFNYFENNRLELEEFGQTLIKGFMPENEVIDSKQIGAINQNKMSYIYGGQFYHAHYPIHIKNVGVLYFPRVVPNGDQFLSNKNIITVNDMYESINNYRKNAKLVNGIFIISITNSFFKNKIASIAFSKILESNEKSIVLADIATWEEKRHNIIFKQNRKSTSCPVSIENKNSTELEKFHITYSTNMSTEKIFIDKIQPGETKNVCLNN